jgi:hypothetical protein
MVWRCFSQVRDTTANDNRSVHDMQGVRRWAESKANEPAFAPFVHMAMAEFQQFMREHRPKEVSHG